MPLRNSDKLPDLTLFHPANSEATTIRDWILREGRQKRTRWAGHSLIAVVHWGRVLLLGPDQHVRLAQLCVRAKSCGPSKGTTGTTPQLQLHGWTR